MPVENLSSRKRKSQYQSTELINKRRKQKHQNIIENTINGNSKKNSFENIINPINSTSKLSECFHKIKTNLYVSLAPKFLNNPLNGVKLQHLDSMIMKYIPNFKGVVLGYNDVKLSSSSPNNENEEITGIVSAGSPFTFLWLSATFLVWSPKPGDALEGYVNMQSPSHIGLLVHDIFNATIKKDGIPRGWSFVPNETNDEEIEEENNIDNKKKFKSLGYWIDENGIPIDDGKFKFAVRKVYISGRFVSIDGTLIDVINAKTSSDFTLPDDKQNGHKFTRTHITFDSEPVVVSKTTQVNDEEDEDIPMYGSNSSDEDSN